MSTHDGPAGAAKASGFRNVSACNRCRLRKNRCDRRLPSCASCAKAGVACVGFDPLTKAEVPRSYVFFLEARVAQLERLLADRGVALPPDAAAGATKKCVASVVFLPVQQRRHDGDDNDDDDDDDDPPGTSMRDSFFGLGARPSVRPATFPGRAVASRLVTLYFEHANPQIPILHRGDFMRVLERAYASRDAPADALALALAPRDQYLLNMVFAIGCGVILGEPLGRPGLQEEDGGETPCRPEEYHASAVVHLEACLASGGGGLEVLQAVLLLANFALLRPVPPGLWSVFG